jgi:soluble lytic murein transglycosylase-like protein
MRAVRLATLALVLMGGIADASELEKCLVDAAAYQKVDFFVLKAIAVEETGMNPSAVGVNANGTSDHGAMQINDWWLPKLKRFGITKQDLYKPCVSAQVAAWILAQEIARHGKTWRAVGAYNSPTEKYQSAYAQRIHKRWLILTGNK